MIRFKTKKGQKITVNTTGIVAWLMVAGFISWGIWGILCCIGNYSENVYGFAIADAEFNRAFGTNNLDNFADRTESGLALLGRYSGNEAWWFPTINTDMDSIKADIQQVIDNARLASNATTYGSDAYQEALDNAKEALSLHMGRVDECEKFYWGFGKTYIGLIWGYIFSAIAIVILSCYMFYLHWNLGRYNRIKN